MKFTSKSYEFKQWASQKEDNIPSNIDDLKIAYVGDGNNIVNSWIRLAAILPFEFTCVCPEGYEPDQDTINFAESITLSVTSLPLSAGKQCMNK